MPSRTPSPRSPRRASSSDTVVDVRHRIVPTIKKPLKYFGILRVKGYLYPVSERKRRPVTILIPAKPLRRAGSVLAQSHLRQVFKGKQRSPIYRAVVTVDEHDFLVCGYHCQSDSNPSISLSLAKIKPSTVWKGEVVLFSLGVRHSILKNPRGTKKMQDSAVSLFLSRITEAIDMGKPVPTSIFY